MLTVSMEPQKIQLGQHCDFQIKTSETNIQLRFYIRHRNVFYLKPLSDWLNTNRFQFFPEAPGAYSLMIEWRTSEGTSGWDSYNFTVESQYTAHDGPQKVQIDAQTQVWVASKWEALLLSGYEEPVVQFMRKTLLPGWTVYDIGANIGLYSILFSRLVGPKGYTYCVEANPLCVYLLRTNLELNGISNYQILPLAALDSAGAVNFTINYGNLGLGVTQRSSFYASKVGHEVGIGGMAMASLIDDFGLKPPQLIKIDVEGAEGFVVEGLDSVLRKHRPILMIEVHGRTAAEQTFKSLERHSYQYKILNNGREFSSVETLLNWFPESVLQVGCLPL